MSVKNSRCPPPLPRAKIPKDGMGPRGAPDCYYTSRVLLSTARYANFIKNLRAEEEEIRIGKLAEVQKAKDVDVLDFFSRCQRKSQIKTVAERVQWCIESYENDVNEKRQRLIALLEADDKRDLRAIVAQAQAGAEAVFQDKMARLAYLLDKRKKELESQFKETPMEKCSHIGPCVRAIQAKEAQVIQLYQMKEKQMRKMAEKEFDKMWYEVAMKERDALAARSEMEEIKRSRREEEFERESKLYITNVGRQREEEKEKLKQEQMLLRATLEAADKQDAEAKQLEKERLMAEMATSLNEKKKKVEEEEAHDKVIVDVWKQLGDERAIAERANLELQRRKYSEQDICNKKLVDIKHNLEKIRDSTDQMILAEGQCIRDAADLKRCLVRKENIIQKKENQKHILKQIKEKEADTQNAEMKKCESEYEKQLEKQMNALVKNKEITDAQARKLHQNDVLAQIEYNKKLKERALQEELEQRKKAEAARKCYNAEIAEMLSRPFVGKQLHQFGKKLNKDLQMPPWCPCAKETYCAVPKPKPINEEGCGDKEKNK